jgi:hypothetical protein
MKRPYITFSAKIKALWHRERIAAAETLTMVKAGP